MIFTTTGLEVSARSMEVNIDISVEELAEQVDLSKFLDEIDDDAIKDYCESRFPEWFENKGD